MDSSRKNEIDGIVNRILDDYNDDREINKVELFNQPDTEEIIEITGKLIKIVYPGFFREKSYRYYNIKNSLAVILEDVMYKLTRQIAIALRQQPGTGEVSSENRDAEAQKISLEFFERIPKIRSFIETDVMAIYDGDPASFNTNEIILCYPGLYAITVFRLAHELYDLNVPLIPRIMSEHAHSRTGIDIHPGATIGKNFFIDHGTGIVVGETTVIGDNVKIYQGVTLGALSTRGGQHLRGKRRHPTIENNVTIYSGASIFGGETVIGENSVIGSNAFITSSIAPGSRVSIKNQELNFMPGEEKDTLQAKDMDPDESWFYVI